MISWKKISLAGSGPCNKLQTHNFYACGRAMGGAGGIILELVYSGPKNEKCHKCWGGRKYDLEQPLETQIHILLFIK